MKVLQAGSLHAYLAYVLVLGVLLLSGSEVRRDADVGASSLGLALLQAARLARRWRRC